MQTDKHTKARRPARIYIEANSANLSRKSNNLGKQICPLMRIKAAVQPHKSAYFVEKIRQACCINFTPYPQDFRKVRSAA
jgi:hypothetical protein